APVADVVLGIGRDARAVELAERRCRRHAAGNRRTPCGGVAGGAIGRLDQVAAAQQLVLAGGDRRGGRRRRVVLLATGSQRGQTGGRQHGAQRRAEGGHGQSPVVSPGVFSTTSLTAW